MALSTMLLPPTVLLSSFPPNVSYSVAVVPSSNCAMFNLESDTLILIKKPSLGVVKVFDEID